MGVFSSSRETAGGGRTPGRWKASAARQGRDHGISDDAAAKEFQTSPEYQEISVDRKAGADAVVLTVRGLS
jgi:hypothetical protein